MNHNKLYEMIRSTRVCLKPINNPFLSIQIVSDIIMLNRVHITVYTVEQKSSHEEKFDPGPRNV